jgi:hypothetical protein
MFKTYGVKKSRCLFAKETHIQKRILLCVNDNHKNSQLRTATSINSSALLFTFSNTWLLLQI